MLLSSGRTLDPAPEYASPRFNMFRILMSALTPICIAFAKRGGPHGLLALSIHVYPL
jgi:hypothetical protein